MKKIILIFMLCIPFIVNAECDRELQNTYFEYASDITYETDYSMSKSRYTMTFYNVIDGLTIKYNGKTYKPSNNQVKIDGIKEGTEMNIYIYGNSGCEDSLKYIYIKQPYYNEYYGSTLCYPYVDKITYCTQKFTTVNVDEELVKRAIENYEHVLVQEEEEEVVEEPSLFQIISEFTVKWGVRLALVLVTSFLTNLVFSNKYIKIKHKL